MTEFSGSFGTAMNIGSMKSKYIIMKVYDYKTL